MLIGGGSNKYGDEVVIWGHKEVHDFGKL